MIPFLVPLALVAALALLLILLRTSQTKDQVEVTVIEPWDIDFMETPPHYFLPDRRAEFGRGFWLDADPPTWTWPARPEPVVVK